ncbi:MULTISPECIES: hypothetical protein [Halomonas]|uniref:HEPN domain-containing protein n=1 Tax=Halomonas halophila TaxID=29573 RepID=A0ABQ0U817_9GAMM|nr:MULTISPECIES: hypothetical protein [Halomonas]MDR5891059.1 hypothetical protein [Halomonas salina]WJY08333.1 hypothetical protein QWG60_05325 [Halomonas halophila]GEK74580.1 hypothetical protein HHA04nite_31240 [Halomonas halophila]
MYSDKDGFSKDPFGYSALAWHKWGALATANGFEIDITKPPTVEDLKNPVLWLSHANALSEAAVCLARSSPIFESMPPSIRTICHSQYHAVVLMLVGYSLEVCLKAMILMRLGAEEFTRQEKKHFHHRLDDLAKFIPNLSEKELAILKGLTHFVLWAGRYPDPGSRRVNDAEDVFEISETYKISAKDLFELSAKVMKHVRTVVD